MLLEGPDACTSRFPVVRTSQVDDYVASVPAHLCCAVLVFEADCHLLLNVNIRVCGWVGVRQCIGIITHQNIPVGQRTRATVAPLWK